MNVTMLKRARELWAVEHMSYYENRINMRKWVKAVRMVRDSGNWLLLKQIDRKIEEVA